MAKLRKPILFMISIFLFIGIEDLKCQEMIVSDGVIPNRHYEKKVIPIYSDSAGQYTFILEDNCEYCTGREYYRDISNPFWDGDLYSLYGNAGLIEYYHSQSGTSYVYDSYDDYLYYGRRGIEFNSVYCPGRPLVDSEGNIHIIKGGPGDSLIYIYSRDTLNSYEINQRFLPPSEFVYLVSSPDNAVIGALFYAGGSSSLYKYIASGGEPLNLSIPTEVIFCDYDISWAHDIVLDDMANVYFILTIPAQWSWGIHSFWSENWGIRHLRESWDDVLQGTVYQICFGARDGELLAIHGENVMGDLTQFFYSSDGGNIWYKSSLELSPTYYGSAPRTFSDTLHFIYYKGDGYYFPLRTYHYPIPLNLILDNMTAISEETLEYPSNVYLSNYPNPFNASTTISFSLWDAGDVRLAIYDIAGRLVSVLVEGEMESGNHSVVWSGEDRAGETLSSGIYFYSLESRTEKTANRMLFLK